RDHGARPRPLAPPPPRAAAPSLGGARAARWGPSPRRARHRRLRDHARGGPRPLLSAADAGRRRAGGGGPPLRAAPPAAPPPHSPPRPPAALAATRARYGLTRPYVLFVGYFEPKKNLDVLLDAVGRLRRAGEWGDIELVVVGAAGWGADPVPRAHALGLDSAVRFIGAAPDADLPALYGGALAFAFPSLWEGFGL